MIKPYRYSPAIQESLNEATASSTGYINSLTEMSLINSDDNYLVDLSSLRHRLLLGETAKDCLTRHGINTLPAPGHCLQLEDHGLLVCETESRYYLVDGFSNACFPNNIEDCDPQCLFIDYECFDVALGGKDIDILFSEATKIDYRSRDEQDWITTVFARAEVWIKKLKLQGNKHYRLGAAPADGVFLYNYLLASLNEMNGSAINIDTYKKLIQKRD